MDQHSVISTHTKTLQNTSGYSAQPGCTNTQMYVVGPCVLLPRGNLSSVTPQFSIRQQISTFCILLKFLDKLPPHEGQATTFIPPFDRVIQLQLPRQTGDACKNSSFPC
jgi:hypothetical protein